jgi:hypothetical protein
MRFEGRDIEACSEPVSPNSLREGTVYFSVGFVDREMLVPILEPFVFIGRNLTLEVDFYPDEKEDRLFFQDAASYQRGVRFETATADDEAYFDINNAKGMYEYERALDLLLACSLRRKKLSSPS